MALRRLDIRFPWGFDPEKMPADKRAERSNLNIELNKRSAQGRGFPTTIEFEAIKPEGALANYGPLLIKEFKPENGWLTVTWDRSKK